MGLWNRLFGQHDPVESRSTSDASVASVESSPRVVPASSASTAHSPDTSSRRVRVFVSSTFRDMVEDRDTLMTHAWPEVRRFCRERDVELVEVDLRWGIDEARSTRKETLKLCLDEIRACRPFFIGLLIVGERYGLADRDRNTGEDK